MRVRSTMGGVMTLYVGGHTQYKIEAGLPSTETLVSYYSSGAQTIAMREKVGGGSNTLYFLLSDHLGSTSATLDDDGVKIADLRYGPWGVQRWSTGTTPTRQRYTGQTQDVETGLYYYGSRYYDPVVSRFTQADSIVPNPHNPQSLNRYSYVSNNPIKYTDPSGHDEMESQYYVSQWEWRNRWYEAHGYFWNEDTGHWDKGGTAQFADEGILSEVLGEAGIVAHSGFDGKAWTFQELSYIGQAVVKFGQKVGGLDQLQKLLGGGISVVRKSVPSRWESKGCGSYLLACAIAATNTAYFYDYLFSQGELVIRGTVVHELAHLIDFKSGLRAGGSTFFRLSSSLPLSGQNPLTERATNEGPQGYWAEAVALWVYPYYKSNENGGRPIALDPLQVAFIESELVGTP